MPRRAAIAWSAVRPTEWVELPREGRVHTYTTCHFGGEAFLKETPFTLILVEFDGVDTLFLSRLVGAEPEEVMIGMPVRARFLRNCQVQADRRLLRAG